MLAITIALAWGRAGLVAGLLAATLPGAAPSKPTRPAKAAPPARGPSLHYTLAMPAPQTHYFEVQLALEGFVTDYIDLKLPAWAPGSYLLREFSKHVERLHATADGQPLRVEKIDKNTWRVFTPRRGGCRVSYGVYAYEPSARTSYLDADHGFCLPSSVLLYPAGSQELPSTLTVVPAAGFTTVSTALHPAAGQSKFTYQSASYDELADSPLEIGTQQVLHFTAGGTPHQLALVGPHTLPSEARLLADMQRVTEETQRVMGQNPLDYYLFIVHHSEAGAGGLEHLFSSTLGVWPDIYAHEEDYKLFFRLVAHEYVHLWNGKRIRPVALGPFDYDHENYTRMLWVSEGQTEYLANQITQRAGFYTPQEYYDHLAGQLGSVENTPGNRLQPVSEASFNAWTDFYRPDENTANASVSYYDKGELMGMMLDLMLVQATGGHQHLDDVLRLLYDKYYKGLKRGFTDQEYQDAVAQVAGRRFDDFFQHCVYGTRPPDYAAALAAVGLTLSSALASASGSLGASIVNKGGHYLVAAPRPGLAAVRRDGAAWVAGLNAGDELLLLDGAPPTDASLRQLLTATAPGTTVQLQVRHGLFTRDLTLTLPPTPLLAYQLRPAPQATPEQLRLRTKWLGQ